MTLKTTPKQSTKREHDSIFFELTRSICPECKAVIDAQISLRDGKVYMRKRCREHGWFESLLSSDADMYISALKYNKPGTYPRRFSTEVKEGCPLDCGLCPEHKQHTCLAIIEVNTACNLDCPICFADAGPGYNLTLSQVETMLDQFVELENEPEVVQFSGGEPTIHPQIFDMVQMARNKGVRHVMINTNGVRIARDDAFMEKLAEARPYIYMQFDGLESATYKTIRGEDLLGDKLKALDRLAEADLDVALVAAVERGVNEDELGAVVKFGLEHPAVRGVIFQPVFHSGRHLPFDPLDRVTMPDVVKGIQAQTEGLFRVGDFVPVPCCY
ncbi:MAG: radical SAM protein, partial [Dehalococcoidia bacterium]